MAINNEPIPGTIYRAVDFVKYFNNIIEENNRID